MGIVTTPTLSSTALAPLDSALTAAAPAVAAALGTWVVLVLLTAAAVRLLGTRRRSGRALERGLGWLAPGLAGRLLRAAVGLGVTGSTLVGAGLVLPAASAAAAPIGLAPRINAASAAPTGTGTGAFLREARLVLATALPEPLAPLSGPPTPELWPLSTPLRTGAGSGADDSTRRGDVVVQRGDTLWSIAARHLPAHAPDSRIEALWRRWYLRNRAVIGADPNLLLPGQVLRAPF